MAITKRKRKSNPYRAEVFVDGVRVASSAFATAALAHRWHDETKKRYESGRGPAGELTLREVVAEYEAKDLALKRASTRRRALLALSFLKESPIMAVRMADLGAPHVDKLLSFMAAHRRGSSRDRRSFDKELKVLGAVLSYFRDEKDETLTNPVTKRHWKRSKFKGPSVRRADFFIPDDKVLPWLRALLKDRDPVYHAIGVVQVLMGYRLGEAAGLCWPAVDLDRDRMAVMGTMAWWDEEGRHRPAIDHRPKTEASHRFAPIPPMVKAVLLAAKGRWPLSSVVFRNRCGRLVQDGAVRAKFKKAFLEVGLQWTGTHVCRHTHATLGIASERQSEVRVSMGHSSERETERYAHVHAMLTNTVPAAVEAAVRKAGAHHAQIHAQGSEPVENSK